jgi:8-oxo-dGTP pyrophosphatase MutT (NUDIX family)
MKNIIHDFHTFLEVQLKHGKLPGLPSQIKMAPKPVTEGADTRELEAPSSADASSVLILLFPNSEGRLELVLTLRSSNINHGGQLSFPGGRSEKGESEIETALREAKEEIDINREDVNIAGLLSKLYVAHSDNYVTPVVGFLDYVPELTLNPDEVEEAFSVEVESLLVKENLTVENWDLRKSATYKVPYWDVHRVPLWGATAMILSEFLELYEAYKQQNSSIK